MLSRLFVSNGTDSGKMLVSSESNQLESYLNPITTYPPDENARTCNTNLAKEGASAGPRKLWGGGERRAESGKRVSHLDRNK